MAKSDKYESDASEQARQQQPVLVTTERRGVFFGYLVGEVTKEQAVLERCRNVVRWQGVRGFLGLAANGPNDRCRIGPPAPEMKLFGITGAAVCSPEAVKAFEAAPWSK